MAKAEIEALIKDKIGLEVGSLGAEVLTRVLRRRMENCGASTIEDYLLLLQTSSQELDELVENLIVPETWFFRDREPFVFLRGYVVSEWLSNNPGKILRILSVPCATGEEPYSIAIALMEAGLNRQQFSIDAVDLSSKSLQKAQQGIYRKNSFRGQSLDFQNQYFTYLGDEYELSENVRRSVNFCQDNLIDPDFLTYQLPYDIIFCRNLLIYFDNSARKKAIQALDRLLKNQGLLFVGSSETTEISSSRFLSVRHSFAFAFRKIEEAKEISTWEEQGNKGKQEQPSRATSKPRKAGVTAKAGKVAKNYPLPIPHSSTLDFPSKVPELEMVRSLADQGQLNKATTLCEIYLSQNRLSAEAYVLLGQLHQAMGNEEQAEQSFQKAIYLEPNGYEALIHLALLAEQRGDSAKAAIIRQRIQRHQKLAK